MFRPVGRQVIEAMLNQLLDFILHFAKRGLDFVRAREHSLFRYQLFDFEQRQKRLERLPEAQRVDEC